MSDKIKNRIFLIASLLILALSVTLTVIFYRAPLLRFWHSLVDLGKSAAYFFLFVFVPSYDVSTLSRPAASLPDVSGYVDYIGFNFTIEQITDFFKVLWERVSDVFIFAEYNTFLFERLYLILMLALPLLPCLIGIFYIIKSFYMAGKDTPAGDKSSGYDLFEKITLVLKKAFDFVAEFLHYFKTKKIFLLSFALIWLLNLCVFPYVLDFFSFYLFFAASFNFFSFICLLFRYIVNAFMMFKGAPFIFWLCFGFCIYYEYHKRKALDLLRHNEAKNCGFLKTLELIVLIIGEPGKGKTTLLTDMVLSWVNIFKQEALDTLYEYEMLFPGFSFAAFRAALVPMIEERSIWCVPQIDDVVDDMFKQYEESDNDNTYLYGYNDKLYGFTVDLGNSTLELKEALKTYGKAFVVYYNDNPSLSNYPIRFDGTFDNSKFLQLWNGDFFNRKKKSVSRYSHVLQQDIMRFGKRVDPDNPYIGSYGYGIYSNTEWAKSYGNQNTNADYDSQAEEANPKNDFYSYSLMMARHPNVTIDNKVYFRFIGDEQRAPSLAADKRELCTIISIEEKGELKIALRGFNWLFAIRDKVCSPFEDFYLEYQNVRADMTLLLMVPKLFVSFINLICKRIENVYGYREIILVKNKGDAYSGNSPTKTEPERHVYYQANMKTYSKRFMTDCYAKLFTELQKKCGVGLMDMPCFEGLDMSVEEMDALQNDYFLMKLMGMLHGVDPEEQDHKKQTSQKQNFEIFDL